MKAYRAFLSVCILVLVCTGCQSARQDQPTDTPATTPTAPAFLRVRPGMMGPYPAALGSGVLVVRDRCIRLVMPRDPQGYAVIWNEQMSFDGTTITDSETHMQTQIGVAVTLGGGMGGEYYLDYLDNPADNPCSPPYWLAGHISWYR